MLSYPGCHCYVQVTSSSEIASEHNQGLLEAYFKINKYIDKLKKVVSKKRIHYSCEGRIEKSVPWDYHLSSLGKPRDAKQ